MTCLLCIDVQKLFHTHFEENLGIYTVCYFLLFHYFKLFLYFELFVISLNFEKQFQEMMNEFKIKPIIATDLAHRVWWKLFFTKTNSHHTVQILKSFKFMHYEMQQILLIFVFMHNSAVQKFQFFVFMGI